MSVEKEEYRYAIPNEEFTQLGADEQQRLIDYNESITSIEHHKKMRILFERAPSETLPFIAYCVFVSVDALGAMILLIGYNGTKWPFFVLIGMAMIAPLFALPSGSFSESFGWIRDVLSLKRTKN